MKTRRNRGWVAAVIVFLVIICTLLWTSYNQNRQVRKAYDIYLQAIQNDDRATIALCYNTDEKSIDPKYFDLLAEYHLFGWKIISISGQPWPMDTPNKQTVTAELYYDLPDKYSGPNGPYKKVMNEYGPCTVVPVTLHHIYGNQSGWFFQRPYGSSADDWPFPYAVVQEKNNAK